MLLNNDYTQRRAESCTALNELLPERSANLMPPDPEIDQANLDALTEVQVHYFKADPLTVAPFGTSTLSWSVVAPARVSIHLNGQKVGRNGSRHLAPSFAATHRLTARAGRYSKSLGVVTVHVESSRCITLTDSQLPKILAAMISDEIHNDDTGLSFRILQVNTSSGPAYAEARPNVQITDDRLSIDLKLRKEVDNFPNASVDAHVSFGLAVVADDVSVIGPRRIVATDLSISVSVSFPFWAYLIPLAFPGLPIAIAMAEDTARKRMTAMVTKIVGPTGSLTDPDRSLNDYFSAPFAMAKHHVRLERDEFGDQLFSVTYCPRPPGPDIDWTVPGTEILRE